MLCCRRHSLSLSFSPTHLSLSSYDKSIARQRKAKKRQLLFVKDFIELTNSLIINTMIFHFLTCQIRGSKLLYLFNTSFTNIKLPTLPPPYTNHQYEVQNEHTHHPKGRLHFNSSWRFFCIKNCVCATLITKNEHVNMVNTHWTQPLK